MCAKKAKEPIVIKEELNQEPKDLFTYAELLKEVLSTSVRSVYQIQKLRIQMGNRVVASFRSKYSSMIDDTVDEGEELSEKEKTKLYEAILGSLKDEYARITDAIVRDFTGKNKSYMGLDGELTASAKRMLEKSSTFEGTQLITHRAEYALVNSYIRTLRTEELQFNDIAKQLEEFPIYTEFLKDVRGCGPALSAIIISYFDIHKAHYPSNMLAYCGIDVAPDGRGRGRFAEHLVEREYVDKNGKDKTRMSITFDPFLKTKMVGVLGTSFLRSASPYRQAYDGYKNRIASRPIQATEDKLSDLHIHRMAVRYMIKIFIIDLYKKWRALEGLPVAPSYEEAKLGMGEHHQGKVNNDPHDRNISGYSHYDPEFNPADPR